MEVEARKIVATASKTYICELHDGNYKLSAKGANRRELLRNNPMERYEEALMHKKDVVVTNRGFVAQAGVIRSYSVNRTVISFMYFKRYVHPNGFHTSAYEHLILDPVPKTYTCIATDVKELSLDYAWERRFRYEGKKFHTMRQAYCYSKLCYIRRMLRADPSEANRKVSSGSRAY